MRFALATQGDEEVDVYDAVSGESVLSGSSSGSGVEEVKAPRVRPPRKIRKADGPLGMRWKTVNLTTLPRCGQHCLAR